MTVDRQAPWELSYGYGNCNPLMYRDPSGEFATLSAAVYVGAAVGKAFLATVAAAGVAAVSYKFGNTGAQIYRGEYDYSRAAEDSFLFASVGAGLAIGAGVISAPVTVPLGLLVASRAFTIRRDLNEGKSPSSIIKREAMILAFAALTYGVGQVVAGLETAIAHEAAAIGAAHQARAAALWNAGAAQIQAAAVTSTLPANKIAGKAWENLCSNNSPAGFDSAEQVTLKVNTPSGPVTIRADELLREQITKEYSLVEAKSSATAPLSKNQGQALPELGRGVTAEVRGVKGLRIGLRSGQIIKIKDVYIVRPTGTTLIK